MNRMSVLFEHDRAETEHGAGDSQRNNRAVDAEPRREARNRLVVGVFVVVRKECSHTFIVTRSVEAETPTCCGPSAVFLACSSRGTMAQQCCSAAQDLVAGSYRVTAVPTGDRDVA